MGIKEAYKRIDKELDNQLELARKNIMNSFNDGGASALNYVLKIIEQECPEVLEDNNGN